MLGSILIRLAAIAVLGFAFLVLVGLWTATSEALWPWASAVRSSATLALQAGFPDDPHGYRWATTVAELQE